MQEGQTDAKKSRARKKEIEGKKMMRTSTDRDEASTVGAKRTRATVGENARREGRGGRGETGKAVKGGTLEVAEKKRKGAPSGSAARRGVAERALRRVTTLPSDGDARGWRCRARGKAIAIAIAFAPGGASDCRARSVWRHETRTADGSRKASTSLGSAQRAHGVRLSDEDAAR